MEKENIKSSLKSNEIPNSEKLKPFGKLKKDSSKNISLENGLKNSLNLLKSKFLSLKKLNFRKLFFSVFGKTSFEKKFLNSVKTSSVICEKKKNSKVFASLPVKSSTENFAFADSNELNFSNLEKTEFENGNVALSWNVFPELKFFIFIYSLRHKACFF
jgi:hypothetical protein